MKTIHNNQGIALVIALLFLLVTTLLGVSTLQANLFGEKMTLNAIQREQALEAAEGALLEGEAFVEDFKTLIVESVLESDRTASTESGNCRATVNSQGGICVPIQATAGFDDDSLEQWIEITSGAGSSESNNVWSTAGRHREASDTLREKYDLASAPRYIVEFMGFVPLADGSNSCDPAGAGSTLSPADQTAALSWPFCWLDRYQFRITSIATAGNYGEARVMLQSTYVVGQ